MIERRKLADSVIEEIKRMMRNDELKNGDKLPNQNEFAAQLGVSRPSLREALHTLALMGAIEQKPGYGTVIRARLPELISQNFIPPFMSDTNATKELICCRQYIEVANVEQAVQNATDREIAQIGDLVNQMKEAYKQGEAEGYTELDIKFHHGIANASHNRYLIHAYGTLRGSMEEFRREILSVLPGHRRRAMKFHIDIYNGIKERNMKKAATMMKRHIIDVSRNVERYYRVSGKE